MIVHLIFPSFSYIYKNNAWKLQWNSVNGCRSKMSYSELKVHRVGKVGVAVLSNRKIQNYSKTYSTI